MVIIKKTGLIISEDTKRTKSEDGAAKLFANHSMIGLPSSWDWRNVDKINYMTPVQNQGDCGSCVAFGTNAAVEVSKRVANHSPKEDVKLSEWDIFSHGGSCYNGWTLEGANVAAKNYGMCPDKCWPYNGEKQSCASDRTLKTRIIGSVRISSDAEAKAWIATKGPIQAAMNVYEDFYEVNSSKIYKHEYGNLAGGHCICICGYDNTNNCWIGKNSWSTEWGDNGYFRIAYGDCGILRDYIAYGEQVASNKVQLTINTKNVDNANIYNNNTIIGQTNTNIFMDPGNYNLTIKQESYYDYKIPITLELGKAQTITITMNMLPKMDLVLPADSNLSIKPIVISDNTLKICIGSHEYSLASLRNYEYNNIGEFKKGGYIIQLKDTTDNYYPIETISGIQNSQYGYLGKINNNNTLFIIKIS